MLSMRKTLRAVSMAVILLTVAGCGGGSGSSGTTTQFDEQDLNDNATTIQANVNAASLIFVGTVKQVGTAPAAWGGIADEGQIVTYTIGTADQILKDTNSVATAGADINIMHLIIDENRQTSSSAELDATLFAVGSQIIVLASQSAALIAVGSDTWEAYATHTDVDGQFSAIPNTTNNLAAIRAMISSAAAMIVKEEDLYKGYYTDKTFDVTGASADVTAWNNLLDECKAASSEFTALWNLVNDSATEVTFNLGRNQERVFVDSFKGKQVDLTDLEAWKTNGGLLGCNSTNGLCQILAHILMEYYHAATTGEDYVHSHEAALLKENDIREGVPKATIQSGHVGLRRGGKFYVVTGFNNGTRELVEVTDGTDPGVGTFTVEDVP